MLHNAIRIYIYDILYIYIYINKCCHKKSGGQVWVFAVERGDNLLNVDDNEIHPAV